MTSIAEHQSAVIQQLIDEVAGLRERVSCLESDLAEVKANFVPEIIELREVSREQAKLEIRELFGTTEGPLYFSDIEAQLGIELELVVEVCRELIDEGAIGLDGNSV